MSEIIKIKRGNTAISTPLDENKDGELLYQKGSGDTTGKLFINQDGNLKLLSDQTQLNEDLDSKLNIQQNVANSGMVMTVGSDGKIVPKAGSATQIQSDFAQTNTAATDYIKNKPVMEDYVEYIDSWSPGYKSAIVSHLQSGDSYLGLVEISDGNFEVGDTLQIDSLPQSGNQWSKFVYLADGVNYVNHILNNQGWGSFIRLLVNLNIGGTINNLISIDLDPTPVNDTLLKTYRITAITKSEYAYDLTNFGLTKQDLLVTSTTGAFTAFDTLIKVVIDGEYKKITQENLLSVISHYKDHWEWSEQFLNTGSANSVQAVVDLGDNVLLVVRQATSTGNWDIAVINSYSNIIAYLLNGSRQNVGGAITALGGYLDNMPIGSELLISDNAYSAVGGTTIECVFTYALGPSFTFKRSYKIIATGRPAWLNIFVKKLV
jgi:hypothetical protein